MAARGGGKASADRRVEGVRIKVGNRFASFLPLWVEVFTPPNDVVEVAVEDAAVIACRVDVVVQLRQFDLVVTAAASSNVEVANLFAV